jgi:GNAT superfamily N-acetyltransferase
MTDYIIRPVTEKDMNGLLLLIAEHATFEQEDYNPDHKLEGLKKALFGQPVKLHCWVVEQEGNLTGYVSFTFDYSTWGAGDFMYMDCLYLRETTRGHGIGSSIIKKLQQIAREHNCINIQWQTPTFNEPAIRFYHKNKATSKNKIRFKLIP